MIASTNFSGPGGCQDKWRQPWVRYESIVGFREAMERMERNGSNWNPERRRVGSMTSIFSPCPKPAQLPSAAARTASLRAPTTSCLRSPALSSTVWVCRISAETGKPGELPHSPLGFAAVGSNRGQVRIREREMGAMKAAVGDAVVTFMWVFCASTLGLMTSLIANVIGVQGFWASFGIITGHV
ncbi:hypothetical protein ACLB2K_037452 [Fragaria x ananassa]